MFIKKQKYFLSFFSDRQLVPVPAAGQSLRLLEDEPEGVAHQDRRRLRRSGAQE